MTSDQFNLADEAIDDADRRVLALLRGGFETCDPVPDGLTERIKFAMTVAALEAEVAEIVTEPALSGVRSVDYDRASTVTFTSVTVDLMVTIDPRSAGRADLIGHASRSGARVEMRERSRTRQTTTDEHGRFSFHDVERGLVNFVVQIDDDGSSAPVVTPAIEL